MVWAGAAGAGRGRLGAAALGAVVGRDGAAGASDPTDAAGVLADSAGAAEAVAKPSSHFDRAVAAERAGRRINRQICKCIPKFRRRSLLGIVAGRRVFESPADHEPRTTAPQFLSASLA